MGETGDKILPSQKSNLIEGKGGKNLRFVAIVNDPS